MQSYKAFVLNENTKKLNKAKRFKLVEDAISKELKKICK